MAKVYVPDIECDSCVRLISRKFKDSNISNFKIEPDAVELEASRADEAISIIKRLGFRASKEPFERKIFRERLKHFRENRHKYDTEVKGIAYAVNVFVILELLFIVSYLGFLKNIPDFLSNYGVWIMYLILSVSALGFGMWHFYAYRARITCMAGMMIGMTFGMQTGMMIGAIVGATNGFFMGSMVGMLLGCFAGFMTGKCCGVMGVMEGLMAGLMGGTMGAMISVMMLYDHIAIFMPFYMGINLLIIAGLSYMFYEEVVEKDNGVERKPVDLLTFISIAIIVAFIIAALMIYGPKSAIIAF